MRVLFSSTSGSNHFRSLMPFVDACAARGHDVLICGESSLAGVVRSAGYEFAQFDSPDGLAEVMSRARSVPASERERFLIGETWGGRRPRASLPGLDRACREWGPDALVRESAELGSALAAELHGIPQIRVGVGLASYEEYIIERCAESLDELRRSVGLPSDPNAAGLLGGPYVTFFPRSLDEPASVVPSHTLRVRDPDWDAPGPSLRRRWDGTLRYRWDEGDTPLIYMTFGSERTRNARELYASAMEVVAELPVRAVVSRSPLADPGAGERPPDNVRLEPWVRQIDVLSDATLVVCHGGSGTLLGSLAAGLPVVVVPLFGDQHHNARRVAEVGAGVIAELDTRAIREAILRVLEHERYRRHAQELGGELRTHAPCEDVVGMLEKLTTPATSAGAGSETAV